MNGADRSWVMNSGGKLGCASVESVLGTTGGMERCAVGVSSTSLSSSKGE